VECRAEVVHRTRRTVTAEGKTHDEAGNLVSMGTATFRVFESAGAPAV
jgi:acyl-coenzyme A thioesterase PaaI-like protein